LTVLGKYKIHISLTANFDLSESAYSSTTA